MPSSACQKKQPGLLHHPWLEGHGRHLRLELDADADPGRTFFFNDTATTEIYTLSLHDALPIPTTLARSRSAGSLRNAALMVVIAFCVAARDRKSTRLNSSHGYISYAVFCLKKKKNKNTEQLDGQFKQSKERE